MISFVFHPSVAWNFYETPNIAKDLLLQFKKGKSWVSKSHFRISIKAYTMSRSENEPKSKLKANCISHEINLGNTRQESQKWLF